MSLRELIANGKVGWMRDCDFDEAVGHEMYLAPNIYASEVKLRNSHPDLADPECVVYPMRVIVFDADELEAALTPAEPPAVYIEASASLCLAAKNLLEACYQADAREELPESIDGSLLDAVRDGLMETKPTQPEGAAATPAHP